MNHLNHRNLAGENKRTGKPRWPVLLTVIVCCALISVAAIFIVMRILPPNLPTGAGNISGAASLASGVDIDPNAKDYTGEQSVPAAGKANPNATQTQIPGYDTLKLDSGTGRLNAALRNPAGNPCYFVIRLVVEGREAYKTKMVPPGQAIYGVKIESSLDNGTYEAVLKYECFHVQTLAPLNGADVNVKLVVE